MGRHATHCLHIEMCQPPALEDTLRDGRTGTLVDDADEEASTGARVSVCVFSSRSGSFRNGDGRVVVVVVVVRRDGGKGGACEDSWTKDVDEE